MRRSTPIWDDAIGDAERRLLDPGPDALDRTPDVLVVGGGAVGLGAAVMCRRAGFERVQVIERDRCGAGPSGSAAGGISPVMHAVAHPAFAALARESLLAHRRLDEEWSGGLGIRPLDWLLASTERVAPEALDVPGMRAVDADEAHAIEPHLGDVGGAVHVRDQAWVHPVRLAVAYARNAGSVASRVAMTGLTTAHDRVTRVDTTAGPIEPGAVIVATGTCPSDLAEVPRAIVKGHLLATAPLDVRVRTALASTVIVIPLEDGSLLAGGTFHPDDETAEVRDEIVAEIQKQVEWLVPDAAGVPVARAWCCFRPGTGDEMPVIDRVPGLENAWMSVGHYRTGLMMAPAAGEALGSWIATGARPEAVEAFSLARFVKTT
jgi:glycine oxidase